MPIGQVITKDIFTSTYFPLQKYWNFSYFYNRKFNLLMTGFEPRISSSESIPLYQLSHNSCPSLGTFYFGLATSLICTLRQTSLAELCDTTVASWHVIDLNIFRSFLLLFNLPPSSSSSSSAFPILLQISVTKWLNNFSLLGFFQYFKFAQNV